MADFASILDKWEESQRTRPDADSILREKGDGAAPVSASMSINALRSLAPERELDLHGYTADQARAALAGFVNDCSRAGLRKISIITGKGLHSAGDGVLREAALDYLRSCRGKVSEIQKVSARYGGSGVLWVILKRH